ncbi:cytochrome ubiquinol oxidase subunit I [Rugosimonospora africana]|uniref:Cytochrome ubiquinol oxidase subunit I n=1 Tax=Rugosimonospora africana TaxID=556532 RepID=A0A8J3QS37_9ACTN|nr:cytochrome ubiquinol oxidase subunit I [Rugosimonospora africana]GIH15242.1 cytochrome ubiquinol oxidase subunit I [Rugosimonospora africana]
MACGVCALAADVVPARVQMGSSLGFHIILACFGVAAPTVMLAAEWIGIRRDDPSALLLARRWSKVVALLFAVGAVSGTVLSYEMGLLWPRLMSRFGSAMGIGFSIEGVWFFVEAAFVSVYLYGWRRLKPWLHWCTGLPVAAAGVFGAWAVVSVNSWMNQPRGFTLRDGRVVSIDPIAVFFNRATAYEVPHMILAAYMVTGFVFAGVYAVGMLRGRRDRYHRLGFLVPFTIAGIATPLQVGVGDYAARAIAAQQPVKFAVMELVPHTGRGVTEWLGGIWWNGHVYFGVGVPKLDSILVDFDPDAKVIGWDTVPASERPPLANLIHLSFDLMVGVGTILMALVAWQAWHWYFHRRVLTTRWFLAPIALSGLASVAAMECGWIVTEVGRQPWMIYQVQRVNDAVTTAHGVPVTLGWVLAVYLVMTFVSIGTPVLLSHRWRREKPEIEDAQDVPYAPAGRQET